MSLMLLINHIKNQSIKTDLLLLLRTCLMHAPHVPSPTHTFTHTNSLYFDQVCSSSESTGSGSDPASDAAPAQHTHARSHKQKKEKDTSRRRGYTHAIICDGQTRLEDRRPGPPTTAEPRPERVGSGGGGEEGES